MVNKRSDAVIMFKHCEEIMGFLCAQALQSVQHYIMFDIKNRSERKL